MAIHDHFYSTKPATVTDLRWRLQVLAELGVGRLLRKELKREDEIYEDAMRGLA